MFDFADETAPTASRETEPNPFLAVVASLTANDGKAKGFDTAPDKANLTKIRRQLTAAGDAANVTVRSLALAKALRKGAPPVDQSKPFHITFFAVTKIVKGKDVVTAEAPAVGEDNNATVPVPTPESIAATTPKPVTSRTRAAKK